MKLWHDEFLFVCQIWFLAVAGYGREWHTGKDFSIFVCCARIYQNGRKDDAVRPTVDMWIS